MRRIFDGDNRAPAYVLNSLMARRVIRGDIEDLATWAVVNRGNPIRRPSGTSAGPQGIRNPVAAWLEWHGNRPAYAPACGYTI